MMAGRFESSALAFARVFANADLRRLQAAYAGAWIVDWAYTVALGILAFRLGGAVAVGIAGLARMLPSAVISPLSSFLGDRYRRNVLLLWVQGLWTLALAASWLAVVEHWPQAALYAIAGVTGVCMTLFRAIVIALIPWLAGSAEELVSSNVVSSTIEGLGTLIGPLVGGAVVAAVSPQAVFLGAAAVSLGGLGLVALIHPEGQELRTGQSVRRAVLAEIGEGLRAIRENRGARLIIQLFVAQAFVRGALNVFAVVAALGVLGMGDAGVGELTAAVGAGGLVGSAFSVSLVGRRLGLPLATGLILWGLPLVVVGARAEPSVALAALAVIGIGNAILDVAGLTLLQRLVPDAVLGRVVGLLVGAATAAIGIGSIVTPQVISALGIKGAMAVVGGSLVLCALIALPRLRRLDRSAGSAAPEAGLVRRTPMFASLSVAATEHLASRLQDVDVTAGTELIREGEQGDCFYLIADGDFDVTAGGRFVARLGPGDHFGEIALLREVRRTATVTAVTRGRVEAVDRAGFVAAVFGHAVSAASANESIDRRLAELRRVASDGG